MFFTPVVRRTAYAPTPRSVDRSLERFIHEALLVSTPARTAQPVVTQDEQSTTLQLDVPGLGREHLAIQIEDNVVRIESVKDAPRAFKASYALAQDIDSAASEAKLEHGVLTLKLGKKQPVSNATALQIA